MDKYKIVKQHGTGLLKILSHENRVTGFIETNTVYINDIMFTIEGGAYFSEQTFHILKGTYDILVEDLTEEQVHEEAYKLNHE